MRYMKQSNPYPLRLEDILAQKLKYLSNQNNRSYNKEIEFILKKYMEQYEMEHGKILLAETELS